MRCETCQQQATVHIDPVGWHFCESCLAKINQKLESMIAKFNTKELESEDYGVVMVGGEYDADRCHIRPLTIMLELPKGVEGGSLASKESELERVESKGVVRYQLHILNGKPIYVLYGRTLDWAVEQLLGGYKYKPDSNNETMS